MTKFIQLLVVSILAEKILSELRYFADKRKIKVKYWKLKGRKIFRNLSTSKHRWACWREDKQVRRLDYRKIC